MADQTASSKSPQLLLGEDKCDGHMTVHLGSFLLFDIAITHELDSLERCWSDWATPQSLRRDIWENFER